MASSAGAALLMKISWSGRTERACSRRLWLLYESFWRNRSTARYQTDYSFLLVRLASWGRWIIGGSCWIGRPAPLSGWFIRCVSQSVQLVTSIVLPTINSCSFFSSGSSFIFPDDFFHNSGINLSSKKLSDEVEGGGMEWWRDGGMGSPLAQKLEYSRVQHICKMVGTLNYFACFFDEFGLLSSLPTRRQNRFKRRRDSQILRGETRVWRNNFQRRFSTTGRISSSLMS